LRNSNSKDAFKKTIKEQILTNNEKKEKDTNLKKTFLQYIKSNENTKQVKIFENHLTRT